MKQRTSWAVPCRFLALVAAGVGLLYLRDPHSLLVPTLYTEDGTWMAKILGRGFWHTLVFAKGGERPYFVVLNVLLLEAAHLLNAACFGSSLAQLPRFVSGLAMTFYAAVAAAPVWLLRRELAPLPRALVWAAFIFMPLGTSSFEILGRVSNIGYAMPFLCLCLLVWRRSANRETPGRIIAADAGIFLCATTNPLSYPLIAADYAARLWPLLRTGVGPLTVIRRSPSARSALGLVVALAVAVVGMSFLEPRPNAFLRRDFDPAELIEAIVARSLLYPLVFPWYQRLNDTLAVMGLGAVGVVGWWLTAESPRERRLAAATIAAAVAIASATVALRPGLTSLLHRYTTTGLDRYFYGSSILVMLALVVAISAGSRAQVRLRRAGAALMGTMLVAVYAVHAGSLVEPGHSRWHDFPTRDFASAVASAASLPCDEGGAVPVRLHPSSWQARFPAANVRATAIAIGDRPIRR